jgi:peptidoglycan/LPS O-acetylase OafA/YrhL
MNRIPSLDGLRAIAILMVLLAHTALSSGYESWWLHIYARAGVLIFFTVSGYLITTLMLRETEQNGSLNVRSFYLRRAWRILPVAYAYLLVITILRWQQFSWADIWFSWGYLSSIGMLFKSYPWDLSQWSFRSRKG